MGFITALLLGFIIWSEIRDRKKTAEAVLSYQRGSDISPESTQGRFSSLQMILPQLRVQVSHNVVPVSQIGSTLGMTNDKEVSTLLTDHIKSLQEAHEKPNYYVDEKKQQIIFKSYWEKLFERFITDLPSILGAAVIILVLEIILITLLGMLIWLVIFIT